MTFMTRGVNHSAQTASAEPEFVVGQKVQCWGYPGIVEQLLEDRTAMVRIIYSDALVRARLSALR